MTLCGMTWDHPRAYRPLEAFAATGAGPDVTWARQSLADFEARPIPAVAVDHDLMVLDHPGLGSAIAAGALRPLASVVRRDTLEAWRARAVGPTWDSYALLGDQWAVPVDAATQVSVLSSTDARPAPIDWHDVPTMAAEVPTALCLGGPHAFLGLLAMASSPRHPGDGRPGAPLLDPVTATAALTLLRELWPVVDREVSLGDPIAVHEAVATRTVDYCPLAYGYASYARPALGAEAVRWSGAPAFASPRPGSVLGGTGLAVSALRDVDDHEVRAFLAAFLDSAVQTGLVPDHAGQPADRQAWDDPDLDAGWGGFYSSTRASLEAALVRPRVAGWIGVQEQAGGLVRDAVVSGADAGAVVGEINRLFDRLPVPPLTEAGTR